MWSEEAFFALLFECHNIILTKRRWRKVCRKKWRACWRWEAKVNDSGWRKTRIWSAKVRDGFLHLMWRRKEVEGASEGALPKTRSAAAKVTRTRSAFFWLWETNQQKEETVSSRQRRSSDVHGLLAYPKRKAHGRNGEGGLHQADTRLERLLCWWNVKIFIQGYRLRWKAVV